MSTSVRSWVVAVLALAVLLYLRHATENQSPIAAAAPRVTKETANRASSMIAPAPVRATAPAANADSDARVRRASAIASTTSFSSWLTDWRRGEQPPLIRGVELARVRRAALKELIAIDPRLALAQAIPRGLRADLPPQIVAELEIPIDAFASYEVEAVCFGAKDALLRHATIGGTRYEAYVFGRRLDAPSKDRLPVHGMAIDDRLAIDDRPYRRLDAGELGAGNEWADGLVVAVGDEIQSFTSGAALDQWSEQVAHGELAPGLALDVAEPQRAAAVTVSWVFGEKSVLWLRAELPDNPGSPATDQQITDSMTAVNAYYDEVSRGRTSFKTTIFPGTLITSATKAQVADAPTNGQRLISDDVLQQARDYDAAHGGTGQYNPDKYDRWIVIFKNISGLQAGISDGTTISWAGLASVGGKSLWLNGTSSAGVVAHELGHNQGLKHSHSWKPSGGSPIQPGSTVEYGDVFDVMGNSGSIPSGHFNTKQKSNLLYLSADEITTATAEGIYRVYRTDNRNASGVQAVRVTAGSSYDYWLEFRQQVAPNFNVVAASRLRNGVLLHWGLRPSFVTVGSGTYLLDATPTSTQGMNDAALALGETFTDPDFGINITPLATGGSSPSEYIDVRVNFGATGDNHNPTLTAASASMAPLVARNDITFTTAGSDPDGDPIIYRWDFGDGQTNPTSASVTHRWLKGGRYPVSVTAIDGKGGFASKSSTFDVTDPLLTWTRRGEDLTTQWLYAVVYGNGRFVATGAAGVILVSGDGVSWTKANGVPTALTARGVAYGAGRYVAVGSNYVAPAFVGSIVSSSDGGIWQAATLPPAPAELNAVAAGAGRFVTVGKNGKIYQSTDGGTWLEATSPVTLELRAIAFANGQFVAVGAAGQIVTSTDGLNWQNRTVASGTTLIGVARVQGSWFAMSGFEVWTSADGATWAKASTTPSVSINGVASVPSGLLLAGTNDGRVALAEGERLWDTVSLNGTDTSTSVYAVAEGNGVVVAIGSRGAIYTAGTPTALAPRVSDPAGVAQVSAGRPNLIGFDAPNAVKVELLVDGQKVAEADPLSPGLSWTPPRFGQYSVAVRSTTASGAVLQSAPIVAKAIFSDWTWRNLQPIGNDLNSAVRVDGKWWIAGDAGTVLCLDQTGNASRIDLHTTTSFKAIGYANGRFVLAGWGYNYVLGTGAPAIWTSTDGQNWAPWAAGTYLYFNGLAFNGGTWVAAGENGKLARSADGVTWTTPSSPITTGLYAVTFGAGTWVAVGNGGKMLTSTDGLAWQERPSGTASNLYGITFAAGHFIAVGANGEILDSADAVTWAHRSSGVTQTLRTVGFVKGSFVAAGDSGKVLTSADGSTWTPGTLDGRSLTALGIASGEGDAIMLAAAGEYFTPQTAATWTRAARGGPESVRSLICVNGRFVGVTDGYDYTQSKWTAPIITSTDGLTWTQQAAGTFAQLTGVSYGRQMFVAVGQSGRIYTSTDAATWAQRSSGGTTALYTAASADAGHVAAGLNGRIVSSTDGINWTARDSGTTEALRAAAFGNNRFVLVGGAGTIVSSFDGVTWTPQSSGVKTDLWAITWADGIGFIAGGTGGTLLVSPDGSTWSPRAPGITDTIYTLGSTTLGVVGGAGTNGMMLFSADGTTWIKGEVPDERTMRSLALSSGIGVLVGDNGSILTTPLQSTAPIIVAGPQSASVTSGGQVTLTVVAQNTGNAAYQWFKDGAALSGATNPALTIANADRSNAGAYAVRVATGGGVVTSSPAALTFAESANPGRLVNLSIRTAMSSASDSFTFGFVVGGAGASGTKPLLVRAAGPSLATYGVADFLADPKIEFYAGSTKTGENDDWGGDASIGTMIAQVGAFPFTSPASHDAALYLPRLQPGIGTSVRVTGTGSGQVLAELYDATAATAFTTTTPRLINVSVRKQIGAGVTMGFVVAGAAPRKVLIRAVGPTLGDPPFNVPGVVADPRLVLFSGATQLAANDDWGGTTALSDAFAQVGAFALPSTSKDAALLVTLNPGAYTVQVVGAAGQAGEALIEVYEAP